MFGESTKGLTSLLKGVNFNKILGGANKTLNFVKQALPVYNQIRPMWGNLKTFINMYGAIKTDKAVEPDIKETRPMPVNNNSSINNNIIDTKKIDRANDLNETLTFFQ